MHLPPEVNTSDLASRLRTQGVEYLPGDVCFAQPSQLPGTYLRLAYSLLDTSRIEEAIKRLGEAVASLGA